MASYEPTIATIVTAYKVSKFAYKLHSEAYKEYRKKGDVDAAIQKIGEITMKEAISILKDNRP